MKVSRFALLHFITLMIFLAPTNALAKPSLHVLYQFTGGNDGQAPRAALVEDSSGNLYGTTSEGGGGTACEFGCGTVFELSPVSGGKWNETVLYRFSGGSDGGEPLGRLILDNAGNLYGTASVGGELAGSLCAIGSEVFGCGVVFELSPPVPPGNSWTETVLYTFTGLDGAAPWAGLLFDAMGNLYGTTSGGGGSPACTPGFYPGCGAVFELSPPASQGAPWIYTNVYSFDGVNGETPRSDLTFDKAGNLYGTACGGGVGQGGTVFELVPPIVSGTPWTPNVLVSFSYLSDSCPIAGVVFDSKGNLYGTASGGPSGCTVGCGAVFEVSPTSGGQWTETVIYQFSTSASEFPWAEVVFDKAGNLYGTDIGRFCGSVYRLAAGSRQEAEYDFIKVKGEPCGPFGALMLGPQNAFYGTSGGGGSGSGTAFSLVP